MYIFFEPSYCFRGIRPRRRRRERAVGRPVAPGTYSAAGARPPLGHRGAGPDRRGAVRGPPGALAGRRAAHLAAIPPAATNVRSHGAQELILDELAGTDLDGADVTLTGPWNRAPPARAPSPNTSSTQSSAPGNGLRKPLPTVADRHPSRTRSEASAHCQVFTVPSAVTCRDWVMRRTPSTTMSTPMGASVHIVVHSMLWTDDSGVSPRRSRRIVL